MIGPLKAVIRLGTIKFAEQVFPSHMLCSIRQCTDQMVVVKVIICDKCVYFAEVNQ